MAPKEQGNRQNDIALRKKKNADAQAAFRARRANYIATLEETVTSLESVVLQLQDSCREARSEAQELRQQNASLRHEYREREKFWRALWQSRKGDTDELPPLPQPILNGHMSSSQMHPYGPESMSYRSHDDPSICSGQYSGGPNHGGYSHSPSMPYSADVSSENSPQSLTHRGAKYGPYSYSVHGSHRDHSWSQNMGQTAPSGGDPAGPPPSAHSNSPNFSEAPTLTSDLSAPFANRFGEDHKIPVNNLDSAPYVFPGSRSISPTSTTPSSSSAPMTSPFQFTFPDGAVPHERAEFDYRRNSNPRSDVSLHGASAEVSLSGPGSDAVRYRLGTRRADSGADRPSLPILPPLAINDNGSQQDRGSSDGDSNSYTHPRLRSRRDSVISPPSRSTSPSAAPPLSGTLAVIKAQAFGALRRTRARTKKTSDGAARTALDVLEARGIEMGVSSGSKRQRTEESDDGEMQQA
ncbi:hypothetical protein B0H17DRAFT_1035964 [Mycena rosella]|uniref:BZIP domain-containing protein n=1 Tax=Mycena rosella TaxID=1033263 RepID=A0AAD7M938_MYCRO|nr:hypothetical protein B0H17DRAFT_1035964 [Mycena rosella]